MTKTMVCVGTDGRAQTPYYVRTKLGIRGVYQPVIEIEQIIPIDNDANVDKHILNDQRRREAQA